jgi:hypothetical protein
MFQVIAAMREFERELIRERVRAGCETRTQGQAARSAQDGRGCCQGCIPTRTGVRLEANRRGNGHRA